MPRINPLIHQVNASDVKIKILNMEVYWPPEAFIGKGAMSSDDRSLLADNNAIVVLDANDAAELGRLLRKLSGVVGEESKKHFQPASETEQKNYKLQIYQRARLVLDLRKARRTHFSPVLFREPAWDVLLERRVGIAKNLTRAIDG